MLNKNYTTSRQQSRKRFISLSFLVTILFLIHGVCDAKGVAFPRGFTGSSDGEEGRLYLNMLHTRQRKTTYDQLTNQCVCSDARRFAVLPNLSESQKAGYCVSVCGDPVTPDTSVSDSSSDPSPTSTTERPAPTTYDELTNQCVCADARRFAVLPGLSESQKGGYCVSVCGDPVTPDIFVPDSPSDPSPASTTERPAPISTPKGGGQWNGSECVCADSRRYAMLPGLSESQKVGYCVNICGDPISATSSSSYMHSQPTAPVSRTTHTAPTTASVAPTASSTPSPPVAPSNSGTCATAGGPYLIWYMPFVFTALSLTGLPWP